MNDIDEDGSDNAALDLLAKAVREYRWSQRVYDIGAKRGVVCMDLKSRCERLGQVLDLLTDVTLMYEEVVPNEGGETFLSR